MKTLLATLTFLTLFSTVLFSQTNMAGGEATGLWSISDSPFIIDGNITVPPTGKLTIDPGVEVLFSGKYSIEVYGRLDATGTVEDSIYFGMTDTTGFSTIEYEGWLGLSFMSITGLPQEHSLLEYVNIEYCLGSAVICSNASLMIQRSKMKHNKGFGLYLMQATDIIIENIEICDNLMGGIKSVSSAPLISDFIVRNNKGTGILVNGNVYNNLKPVFQHGTIMNNTSINNGGGVSVGMDAYITMTDVSVISNSALKGGGIYCQMGGFELVNSNVSFNEAEYGGGINIESWSSVSIKNTLIADNLANQTGGGIVVFNANVSIDRSTLAYNIAGENSGGIEYKMIGNKVNTISNSILWENYPQEIKTFDAQPQISFSDVMGGYDGNIVMNEDPLFVDVDNSDYHIQWNEYPTESGYKSPAIDSGDPLAELDPDGTIADLGAFYFDQLMVTSLNEKKVTYELSIYPNPVQESFSLNSDTNVSRVQISSLSGQVIEIITNVELNTPINISGLKSGIYLLNIYFENSEVGTMKLIKN